MRQHLCKLWSNDEGQDLIEYTLLLAFVTLSAAVLMSGKAGSSTNVIWTELVQRCPTPQPRRASPAYRETQSKAAVTTYDRICYCYYPETSLCS